MYFDLSSLYLQNIEKNKEKIEKYLTKNKFESKKYQFVLARFLENLCDFNGVFSYCKEEDHR